MSLIEEKLNIANYKNVAIYYHSWLKPNRKVKRLVEQKRNGFNWNP